MFLEVRRGIEHDHEADELGRMEQETGNDIVRSPKLLSVVGGGGDGDGSYNEWSSLEANKAIVSFSVLPPSPRLSLFHLWHNP